MDGIINMITTVGFPIGMCIIMAWYIKYIEDNHKIEINSLREVIEQNTIAITKLYERMEHDYEHDGNNQARI